MNSLLEFIILEKQIVPIVNKKLYLMINLCIKNNLKLMFDFGGIKSVIS